MSGVVMVVGAGPTGLTLACVLAMLGVRVRVIDAAEGPSEHSKALGVYPVTLSLLKRLGCAGALVARGRPLRGSRSLSGGRTLGELDLSGLPVRHPFVLSVPQSETERVLLARLAGLGVQVEWSTALEHLRPGDDGAGVALRGPAGPSSERVAWVIGCDGAGSRVAERLGLRGETAHLPEWFGILDARIEGALPSDQATQVLTASGLLLLIPMPGSGRFRVVATLGATSEEPDPTLRDFQALLDRELPGLRLRDPTWISTFRVQSRLAPRYRLGRVLLAGDAAHVHSPTGGQGMNLGIGDAFDLGWRLGMVASGRARDALLDGYEAERRPLAATTVAQTHQLARLVAVRSHLGRALRDVLTSLLVNRWHDRLTRRLAQLDPPLAPGPTVAAPSLSQRLGRWPTPGTRLALPRDHPLADHLPDRLLLLCTRPGCTEAARLAARWPHALQALPVPELAGEIEPLCLLRPDGVIAWAGPERQAPALAAFLRPLLGPDLRRALPQPEDLLQAR